MTLPDNNPLAPNLTRVPVLPLRDIVVFPNMIVPLFVGRKRSIVALDAVSGNAFKEGKELKEEPKQILLVSQKDAAVDDPEELDIYDVGVVGTILQMLKLPDGTVKVLVEGGQRMRIHRLVQKDPFFIAEVSLMAPPPYDKSEAQALMRSVVAHFDTYVKLNKKIPPEVMATFQSMDDPSRLADTALAHINLKVQEKQVFLETISILERLEKLYVAIEQELDLLQVEKRIRGRVKRQMERSHRDYYLNEQMKAIQKELGDRDDFKDDINELSERIEAAGLSVEAKKKADSEFKKLKQMAPMSAEATVVRNYIDWLVSLPWSKRSRLKYDLVLAEKILEEDHYGLTKVKERILEHLAVQRRVRKMKGPILCLVGPPGVGKTSLARSIARASGRTYARISLGGVRDEAEIRGHRRTYIGSMPGKILQSIKKAGYNNPLFLLDEIDKMGSDYRGDPASALLEVLDPEQNNTFNDHYLEVDYDLSNVMFITTANTMNIPRPLLDRMEVIRLAGYTEDEKLHIAKKFLIPKQREAHGLRGTEFSVSDGALMDIIRYYTREAGVRNLEREIATLARKAIRDIVTTKTTARTSVAMVVNNLVKYLGVRRFHYGLAEESDAVGVATGMAWTEVGGELLTIEALRMEGKGKLMLTGKLGDVMQESAQAAMTYARYRATEWGLCGGEEFQKSDFHIHVPEGATPKDGPSAGVALCIAIISLMSGIAIRRDVAMTGEISLRGRVLMIGGLKEKMLAAHRGGIKHVIIPEDNVKDLKEIPASVLKSLEVHPVSHMDQVLKLALAKELQQRQVVEIPETAVIAQPQGGVQPPALTH